MKCPQCQRQITYRDFDEFLGSNNERPAIALKSCRCAEHGNGRYCRDCCPNDDPKAGPEISLEVKQGKRKPKTKSAK